MGDDAQPSRAIASAGIEVGVQLGQPRLPEVCIDGLQQRPDEALRQPRVPVGVEARCGRDDLVDQSARRREDNVGAHAIGALADAQRTRQALGDPAFHAARRHSHDLGRERVGQRLAEYIPQRAGETICAIGAMDVQHDNQSLIRSQTDSRD